MHDDALGHRHLLPGPGPSGSHPRSTPPGTASRSAPTSPSTPTAGWSAFCGDLHGPRLHVIDPDSYATARDQGAARPPGAAKPWGSTCGGAHFYLDDADRAVVATTDRQVLVVATADAEGDPDLTTRASYDLSKQVPADDCLTALMPDWEGRIWWVTRQGRVGTVGPAGDAQVLDLGEDVANSIAVDQGGVYVVTTQALYRLRAQAGGRPAVTWRAAYDRGSRAEVRPAQPGLRHHADRAARRAGRDHRQRRPAHARAVLRHPQRRPGLPGGGLRGRRERHPELAGLGRHGTWSSRTTTATTAR